MCLLLCQYGLIQNVNVWPSVAIRLICCLCLNTKLQYEFFYCLLIDITSHLFHNNMCTYTGAITKIYFFFVVEEIIILCILFYQILLSALVKQEKDVFNIVSIPMQIKAY